MPADLRNLEETAHVVVLPELFLLPSTQGSQWMVTPSPNELHSETAALL